MVPAVEAPPEVLADIDVERDLLTDRVQVTAERYSNSVHRSVKQLTG